MSGYPSTGITFEPLLCVRYWAYARGPPFLGIMEHDTLISPTKELGPQNGGEECCTPTGALAGHEGEQDSDNVRQEAVIARREGMTAGP